MGKENAAYQQILENEKVALHFITEEDTERILQWRNSPFVMKRFIYRIPLTKEDHENWLKNKVEKGLVAQFVVWDKGIEGGKPIGSTYLRDIDLEKKTAEFGIFFSEEARKGCGLGKAAQLLTLSYATTVLGLERITARILEDNTASLQMHLHNGFQLIEEQKEELLLDGERKTVVFLAYEAK